MLKTCLIFILSLFHITQNSPARPDKDLIGTWVRYKDHKVAEIFIQQADHTFISDLFDNQGMIKSIEKGKWKSLQNTISFSFSYIISLKPDGTYVSENKDNMQPASYGYKLEHNQLKIGSNIYYPMEQRHKY